MNTDNGRHAVVIGGSIVGLMTAHILAKHFDKVTILERDLLPEGVRYRSGAPQVRHLHILLARGILAIEELFPGIGETLTAQGGIQFDWGTDSVAFMRGRPVPRVPIGIAGFNASRVLLETAIRQRVLTNARVELRTGADVTGLLANAARTHVIGVKIRWRARATDPGPEALTADLVVDVSGRGSQTPKWLQAMGYGTPDETIVNSFLGYATRRYEPPADLAVDWRAFLVGVIPPYKPRAGMIFQEEDGNWTVTVMGMARDYPPTDEEGFLAFTYSLSPQFHEAIREATPLTPIKGYQKTENRWRRYERMARLPGNFALIGDAVCAFNPIYGQGMTVGALSALALDAYLQKNGADLSQLAAGFQKRVAKLSEPVWMLATSEDSRWPETVGSTPSWGTRVMHWYADQIVQTIPDSAYVGKKFFQVTHLLKPATYLFHPGVVGRVMKRLLRRKTAVVPDDSTSPIVGPAFLGVAQVKEKIKARGMTVHNRWTDAVLEPMRCEGDALADDVIASLVRSGSVQRVNELMHTLVENDDLVPEALPDIVETYLAKTSVLPEWADREKIAMAEDIFATYGPEIVMLLFCASLPFCYAARKGAQVLYLTQEMTKNVERRVFETAQFLLDVMTEGGFGPEGRAIRSIQKVRLMHAAVRYHIQHTQAWRERWDDAWGLPINQEDLAGTLTSFSATILRGLKNLSVYLTPEEEDAYVHLWNVVGYGLGIYPELLPHNVQDAHDLMDAIATRHWAESEAGYALTKALVKFMEYHLPGNTFDGLPSTTIRQCSGEEVANILGVKQSDWTSSILKLQKAILGINGNPAAGGRELEPVISLFSRKLIEALVWIERGGKRPQFRIPSHLGEKWGIAHQPDAFFRQKLADYRRNGSSTNHNMVTDN